MIRKILFLLPLILLGVACSDINEDERLILGDKVEARRTVLLEDFTGQNCVNCPKAHTTINDLEAQYGDNLIAVSIHCGSFGIPVTNRRYTGLMQPEGDALNDRYNITEWPKGVVNGHGGATNHTEWAEQVRREITVAPVASITPKAVYTADKSAVDISVEIHVIEDIDAQLNVWLLEDGIVARQEDKELGRINDYVHNHVFRACYEGIDGVPVNIKKGFHTQMQARVAVRSGEYEHWNLDNVYAVVFLRDAGGVLQAAKCHIENQEAN